MIIVVALSFLGIVAGFLTGMLGIGSGLVIVPTLSVYYVLIGLSHGFATKLAVGTSLTSIFILSLSAVLAHYRNGNIRFRKLPMILLGGAFGGWFGARIGLFAHPKSVVVLLGVCVILVGWNLLRHDNIEYLGEEMRPLSPLGHLLRALAEFIGRGPAAFIVGLFSGVASGLLGIGGGTVAVPVQRLAGVAITKTVGNTAVVVAGTSFAGMLTYLSVIPEVGSEAFGLTQGYVQVTHALMIGAFGLIGAQVGACLTSPARVHIMRMPVGALYIGLGALFIIEHLVRV